MSLSPLEWHAVVIDKHNSIQEFNDVTTVEIVREQIKGKRADFKVIHDAELTHPGAVPKDVLARTKAEDAALASLDDELSQWQQARPLPA